MDDISSKATINILREFLNLIDERLVEHGEHTAYILYNMLKYENKCTPEELDKFVLIALLHDLGAFKTDDIDNLLSFDEKGVWPHSIYGYLYLKYLSPLNDYADILLYHHLDYNKLDSIENKFKDISQYLNIASTVDILNLNDKSKSIVGYIQKYVNKKFSERAFNLFYKVNKDYNLIDSINDLSYKDKLEEIVNNINLDEKTRVDYLKLLVYSIDFKNEGTVLKTVMSNILSVGIAKEMNLSQKDITNIYYASMFHDLGMLAIPESIIDAPRKLRKDEVCIVRTHVLITENVLKNHINSEILSIACGHHEKIDGSGYPRGLKGNEINMPQRILAVSDIIAALYCSKSYKRSFQKEKIMKIINQEADDNKLCREVVNCVNKNYDKIMEESKEKNDKALEKYWAIKNQYKDIIKKFEKFN